jgi:hypothetical protein
MARNPNVRGRQVVRFFTTARRAQVSFGLPDYVRGVIKRYDTAKLEAVKVVSDIAPALATRRILENYTISAAELVDRVRTANTPDTFRLFASSLRFPLAMFNGRWGGSTSAGASAEIVRGRGKIYPRAFMAQGRFRGRRMLLIFTRARGQKVRMTYGSHKGELRERLIHLRGPSTYQMLTGGDNSGLKWVRLAPDLQTELRDMFIAALTARYSELNATNG